MKKLLLFLAVFFALFAVNAQQVERDMVVLEIGTGTWCQYCPGAAMGADDLIANGKDVAVMENHNGDAFANTYSNARNTYYGINSFPTAKFDGTLTVSGGSHTQSMYSSYLPKYNQRKAIPSSFTIEIYGNNTGADYTLFVRVKQVAACTSTNMKLHVALTQSNIAFNWQGQTELNFVNRLMMPNQSGTTVALDPNDSTQMVNLTFTLNDTYPVEDCELVAFIQDNTSKEVLQGTKVALADLSPGTVQAGFTTDYTTICQGNVVHFYDSSTASPVPPSTWNWSFPGGEPATSTEQNPVVTYPTAGSYSVSLSVSNGMASNSVFRPDYITVNGVPEQAGKPEGESALCSNPANTDYITTGAIKADSYVWKINPASAGVITGTNNIGTVDWVDDFTGTVYVSVKGINACGEGIYSDSLEVTITPSPSVFEITGGGSYCEGGEGVDVGLANSENGIWYRLYKDDVLTGVPITGTGSAISFGKQTVSGNYTIKATVGGVSCEQIMQGAAEVIVNPLPGIPGTPDGPAQVCVNLVPTTDFTTTGTTNVLTYVWELSPAEAGTISGNGTTASATWSTTYFGTVTIKVKGINDCGEGTFSNEKTVEAENCDGIAENNPMLPTILPNPNNGQFNLSWSTNFTGKVNIKVVNAFNTLVYEAKGVNVNRTTSLNISDLSSGVYFLIIENNRSVKAQKFIIQK